MTEYTICHAESSVAERIVIINQLEDVAEKVRNLDLLPIREALDHLDQVIIDCGEVLTMLNKLKEWASQPTEGGPYTLLNMKSSKITLDAC